MESQEEKEKKKNWLKPAEILPCVIIILCVVAAIVAFNIGGTEPRLWGSGEMARTEAAAVQTALQAGMAENDVSSITPGTVTAGATSMTVYYPGGSFQLETYLHLPTHGEWHWNTDGMVDKGCYYAGGGAGCHALSEGKWTYTSGRSCRNCTCS